MSQNNLQLLLKLVTQVFGDCRLNKVLENAQRDFHRIRAQLQSTILFDFKIMNVWRQRYQSIVAITHKEKLRSAIELASA